MGLGKAKRLVVTFFELLRGEKKERISPLTKERVRFEQEVRGQFLKLKEKGLSIPIFTL